MDNPSSESSALDTNQAGALFANLLGGEAEPIKEEESTPEAAAEKLAAEEVTQSEPEAEQSESEPTYTVKIDGKEVPVTLDELRNGYQRQQDYTQKTMAAAEARKAAEAELTTARTERQQYAQQLQNISQQLQSALQEQSQINWTQLLEADPVEYLKQQHLYQQRQAALQNAQAEQMRVQQQSQAEQQKYFQKFLETQQQELLAKLPEWKDEGKAKAEKAALASELKARGFTDAEINNLNDHRLVLEFRDAMRYRELMSRAKEATKKVANLPPKVERPGNAPAKLDGRSSAMQKLSKSGRVEDAASYFAGIL